MRLDHFIRKQFKELQDRLPDTPVEGPVDQGRGMKAFPNHSERPQGFGSWYAQPVGFPPLIVIGGTS